MKVPESDHLFLLLKKGDEDAFQKLYEIYSPIIYGNLIKLTKDREFAQDLLHDIFMTLWDKRESIEIHTSFKSYLFMTAKNLVYNSMRKVAIIQRAENHLKTSHHEHYKHIEEDIYAQETQQILQDAINTLPPKRKEIYKLCKIEKKSYQEISAELNISESTINDHMVKANKHIKEHFEKFKYLYSLIISTFLD